MAHTHPITIALLLLAPSAALSQQAEPRIPVTADVAGMYTGAFGGQGGGIQFTVSTPLPISALSASYTLGGQFWYSQPSITGGIGRRQLFGFGGIVTATWNVADKFFPYVGVPIQGIHSAVPETSISTLPGIAPENQAGGANSFSVGIAGGVTVPISRQLSVFAGATTHSQRLYDVNYTPIWSVEFGISVAPGRSQGRTGGRGGRR